MHSFLFAPLRQSQDIAPCPFCGPSEPMLTLTGTPGHRSITCVACSADGPTKRTTALAWAAWNQRKPGL